MVHGSAGSTAFGIKKNMWAPAAVGRDFDLSPSEPAPLEPFRDDITIVSNTDVRNAEAFTAPEIGGDHFRSSAVFLTQMHPKQTQGSDVLRRHLARSASTRSGSARTRRFRRCSCASRTSIRPAAARYGYSCAYTDSISWAAPDRAAADDPRPARRVRSAVRRRRHAGRARRSGAPKTRSILDWLGTAVDAPAARTSAPPIARASADYLDDVREIERRIQQVEARNSSGEPRELPGAPIGVPDSFDEHVKLMFDLQALAFASDITRVFAFKLGRDASNRVYPESGYKAAFHSASHHGDRDERVTDFAKINKLPRQHAAVFPREAEEHAGRRRQRCSTTRCVIYGSPMGNSNVHNHKRCPLFLAGHAGGAAQGRPAPARRADGTPMANVMLTVDAHAGHGRLQAASATARRAFDLNTVPARRRGRGAVIRRHT